MEVRNYSTGCLLALLLAQLLATSTVLAGRVSGTSFRDSSSQEQLEEGGALISATAEDDKVLLLDGDDMKISGLEGNDDLDAGPGDDMGVGGGPGDDILRGGPGDDLLYGFTGNDKMLGGDGLDLLYGAEGADSLSGGEDEDVLEGGFGDDELNGGDGNDEIDGGPGADRIIGGKGNDLLKGGNSFANEYSDVFVFASDDGSDVIPEGEFRIEKDVFEVPAKASVSIRASGSTDSIVSIDSTTVLLKGISENEAKNLKVVRGGSSKPKPSFLVASIILVAAQIISSFQ